MATLYHYCSNASFLSIISTHKVWAVSGSRFLTIS